MAHGCGKRADAAEPKPEALYRAGRMVGFLALAVPAVGLFAAMVLLPVWAQGAQAQYLAGCQLAEFKDCQAQIAANQRLLAALPADEVLTKRLAESQLPCVPENEVVIRSGQPAMPDLVRPDPHTRPDRPPQWMLRTADRLAKPSTRTGIALLSIMVLGAACFLFAPPGAYVQSTNPKS